MSKIHELVLSSLRKIGLNSYCEYEKALLHAFQKNPPVQEKNWFGRNYFTLARDKIWFANSLIENARMEGYGSEQIWKFSNKLVNEEYVKRVRKHSLDESRHSKIFVLMLKIVFPNSLEDDELRMAVESLYPGYTSINPPPTDLVPQSSKIDGEIALNELIQVHLTEIRAIALQYLLKEAILAHTPNEYQHNINKFMNSLITDETKHIAYTAEIFESAINNGHRDFIFTTIADRQADLNDLTYEELELENINI